MHFPEAVAGQAVVGVQLQGAAKRLQGLAMPAHANMAQTAKHVLHHTQSGQDHDGVPQVKEERAR